MNTERKPHYKGIKLKIAPINFSNPQNVPISWTFLMLIYGLLIGPYCYSQHKIERKPSSDTGLFYSEDNEIANRNKVSQSLTFDVQQVCNGEYDREVRPHHYQLYPRNSENTSRVIIAGKVTGSQKVTFRVEKTIFNQSLATTFYHKYFSANGHFSLELNIHAELAEYCFSYSLNGNDWTIFADHVVCGDVFLVSGQSNASADSDIEQDSLMNLLYGNEEVNKFGKYSRTFKKWSINPICGWGNSQVGGAYGVGVWGLRLQYELQKVTRVPTCLINGAVGGTGMNQHHLHENAPFYCDYASAKYLMGSLLTRVYYAGLENNICAILWYNGEDECRSQNPETGIYTRDFDGLYQSSLEYLGSFRQMYVVQVASYIVPPDAIGYVSEDQRNLPLNYERLKVMSSNGLGPKNPLPGQDIHFSAMAYAELGRRLFNLIQRDIYGINTALNPEPPDILKIRAVGNRIYLDFNQLIDRSSSDPFDKILSVIRFNIPDVAKYNPGIDRNSFYFDVDPAIIPLIMEVSYAGSMPNGEYDLKCYLKNTDSVAALSFYKMALTQGGNPYGINPALGTPMEVKLYPNPVKDIMQISISGDAWETNIKLFNAAGQLVIQQTDMDKVFILDCTNVPSGVYSLRISNKYGFANKKVVVL